MTRVTKIIESVGSSDKSWEEAAQVADEAKKSLQGIHESHKYDCNSR
jgi:dodecin